MSKRFHGEAFVTTGGKAKVTNEARAIRQPRRMLAKLGSFKRQLFGSYDPYQRDQVKEKEEEARDERPTKRRRSLTSALMSGLSAVAYELFWHTDDEKKRLLRGRDIDFSHFQTSSAWESRLQQAEQFIRRVCLQSQQQQRQQRTEASSFGLPPFAAEAYRRAVEEDNSKWGLVSKEDYEVCFLPTIPPPKPKRSIQQYQHCHH
ncbi:hypothetical protein BJV82DRAFT_664394 [Fennellomyces sp. T-0311]|nr:hypothetical protein BJV82DRAFT_664394 [Fennellomyces sp. T-0311]